MTSSGENDPVSIAELTKNAWQWSAQCLFGSGVEQTAGNVYFSQTAMILVATFYLLFIVALGISVYIAVTAFLCFGKRSGWEKNRVIFVTFFFNRVVVAILQALSLLIFIFPKILPFLYLKLLNTYVEVRLSFIDPLILALVVYAIGIIISCVSVSWERKLGMDIFSPIKMTHSEVPAQEENATKRTTEESAFEKMSREAREEQKEKIFKLLNKNNDEK